MTFLSVHVDVCTCVPRDRKLGIYISRNVSCYKKILLTEFFYLILRVSGVGTRVAR